MILFSQLNEDLNEKSIKYLDFFGAWTALAI